MNTDWVVYSKSCLSHTDGVVSYLARYSHRLAISDWRILSIEEDQVRFRTKDYADNNRPKSVTPLGRGVYPPYSDACFTGRPY